MTLQINIKSKIYPSRTPGDHHQALSDINLSIPSSQFVCLVGPSGCGKTTLLNILSGLDKEINGEIKNRKASRKRQHEYWVCFSRSKVNAMVKCD